MKNLLLLTMVAVLFSSPGMIAKASTNAELFSAKKHLKHAPRHKKFKAQKALNSEHHHKPKDPSYK